MSDEADLPAWRGQAGPSPGRPPSEPVAGWDEPCGPSGRRAVGHTLVVALAAALLLVAGLVVSWSDRSTEAPGEAKPAASSSPRSDEDRAAAAHEARAEAVAALLEQRSAALVRDDRAAFLATVDPRSGAFQARQAEWFANLEAVPFADWDFEISAADATDLPAHRLQVLGPDAFASTVLFGYRIEGYDRAPVEGEQYLTFVRRDGRWLVADDADDRHTGLHADPQIWDVGRVNVARGRHSLVLGLRPASTLRRFAAEADRGMVRVSAVWGMDWERKVLLLVTRTDAETAALLGGQPSHYTQLAAITRGEIGVAADAAAADRVLINPKPFDRLSAIGRRVILTHEIAHVAARAHTRAWTPKWLSEGFADYVGYRGTGLPRLVIAEELAGEARRGMLPRTLPGDADFTNANKALPQVYEMSWLACKLIAERYGERRLVRFYRAVARNPGGAAEREAVDRGFRDVLGLTTAEFVADWRAYVSDELR